MSKQVMFYPSKYTSNMYVYSEHTKSEHTKI